MSDAMLEPEGLWVVDVAGGCLAMIQGERVRRMVYGG